MDVPWTYIQQRIYSFYLQGKSVEDIAESSGILFGKFVDPEDVNKIIDEYNELYL